MVPRDGMGCCEKEARSVSETVGLSGMVSLLGKGCLMVPRDGMGCWEKEARSVSEMVGLSGMISLLGKGCLMVPRDGMGCCEDFFMEPWVSRFCWAGEVRLGSRGLNCCRCDPCDWKDCCRMALLVSAAASESPGGNREGLDSSGAVDLLLSTAAGLSLGAGNQSCNCICCGANGALASAVEYNLLGDSFD